MFRFKKNCRLHNFKLIRSLKASGDIFYNSEFFKGKCFITEKNLVFTNLSEIQILITIPKKILKKAVDRNLIKRRIREIFRLNRDKLRYSQNNIICLEFIYISHTILKFEDIKKEMFNIFDDFNKYIEQKNITNVIEFQNNNK